MSSSSRPSLASDLGAPPTQTLTRGNFLLWKALVLPVFRGANVMGLLDGTDRAPPKTLEVEDRDKKMITVENPDYLSRLARDQQVPRFLLNSLSPEILSHVLGMESTAAVWATINTMFSAASRSRVQHLRSALNDTKKKDLTADQYITKMKGFASELATAGKPLEDDELIGYLLHGLGSSYNSLVAAVNGNPGTTLDDFFGQLSSYDMRNEMLDETPEASFTSSANAVQRGGAPSRGDDRQGRGDYHDRGDCGDYRVERGDRGDRGTTATVVTAKDVAITAMIAAVMEADKTDAAMIGVISAVMIVGVVVGVIAPRPPSSMSHARSARYMATLPQIAGGAIKMTLTMMVIGMTTSLHTLHPMVWIPIGIPTRVQ